MLVWDASRCEKIVNRCCRFEGLKWLRFFGEKWVVNVEGIELGGGMLEKRLQIAQSMLAHDKPVFRACRSNFVQKSFELNPWPHTTVQSGIASRESIDDGRP